MHPMAQKGLMMMMMMITQIPLHANCDFFLNEICECFRNPLIFATIRAIPYCFAVRNKGFHLV